MNAKRLDAVMGQSNLIKDGGARLTAIDLMQRICNGKVPWVAIAGRGESHGRTR